MQLTIQGIVETIERKVNQPVNFQVDGARATTAKE
jgi:hypothetical protein